MKTALIVLAVMIIVPLLSIAFTVISDTIRYRGNLDNIKELE